MSVIHTPYINLDQSGNSFNIASGGVSVAGTTVLEAAQGAGYKRLIKYARIVLTADKSGANDDAAAGFDDLTSTFYFGRCYLEYDSQGYSDFTLPHPILIDGNIPLNFRLTGNAANMYAAYQIMWETFN